MVYDEIEGLSRRIAQKADKKGYWHRSQGQLPILKAKEPWATLVETLMKHFDAAKCGCPNLSKPLFARVLGEIPHRNESAHKPQNQEQLKKRDSELRTRFESSCDLLRDLIAASKALRV